MVSPMRLEPLDPDEIRKLRKAHGHEPNCLTCREPQRCTPGMILDTLAQKCPETADTGRQTAPLPVEF